ncbi:MAG: serine hydrolase [Bacteroidales bacterium]|nr:serine hydrolase [Bacteroidales bacterium]
MKTAIAILTILCMGYYGFCQKIDDARLEYSIYRCDSLIVHSDRVFFKNVESLVVYSWGKVLFEKYYNGFNQDSLHHIQSQTKSLVALLMGIAIDKGYIESETEPVSKYFPDHFGSEDSLKSSVTIRDLLTMSAGFEWEEMIAFDDPKNDNMNMYRSGKWLDYALTRPMAKKPYTEFKYNSGLPMIVAGIIEKATEMKLDEFAMKYLFEPLQIKKFRWLQDSTGFYHAGGGLYLKPFDMVKIGILVMNNGKWEHQQVVSEEWIRKTISPHFSTSFDISEYGYFWWIREMELGNGNTAEVISAEGAGGQKLYIFPANRLIIAFTERNYSTPQVSPLFIKESILPLLK